MTETGYTPTPITPVTDKQWDKHIASQEKIALAKIEADCRLETERLRSRGQLIEGRRSFIAYILVGLAFLVFFLALIGWGYSSHKQSEEIKEKVSVACVQAGKQWFDGVGGEEDRCS